jgi:CheY-like chemotaxis protein
MAEGSVAGGRRDAAASTGCGGEVNDSQPKILLAEDNRVMADVLRFNLERAGYAVTVAHDGQQALKICQHECFDLVITDYQMPGLNGEQLCRGIRGGGLQPDVTIFLCSAKTYEIDTQRLSQELQIRRVFYKPFSPRAIIAAVHETLSHSDAVS